MILQAIKILFEGTGKTFPIGKKNNWIKQIKLKAHWGVSAVNSRNIWPSLWINIENITVVNNSTMILSGTIKSKYHQNIRSLVF